MVKARIEGRETVLIIVDDLWEKFNLYHLGLSLTQEIQACARFPQLVAGKEYAPS